MKSVAVVVVMGIAVLSLVRSAAFLVRRDDDRREYVTTLRAIRWWMWPLAFAHIVGLLALVWLLLTAIPPLRIGWWMLLGGSGNILLGQTDRHGGAWQVLTWGFPLALVILIPHLAILEELTFRCGSELDSRWARVRRQGLFGLGHSVLAGVPIAAGIAIIGSGLLYVAIYARAFRTQLGLVRLTEPPPRPDRLDYPSMPEGPHDPAAWDTYRSASRRVSLENKRLIDLWIIERSKQEAQREAEIEQVQIRACAVSAAFHCCTNWILVGALLTWLALS